jgi:hypothetical protein
LSLIGRGANGGVAGTDVHIIFKTGRTVNIRGIDRHQCTNIDIGTVGQVIQTQKGPIIVIMHQHALLNKGSTIHSPCQFEWYKNDVNDKSINIPGDISFPYASKMAWHVCPSVSILIMSGTIYLM